MNFGGPVWHASAAHASPERLRQVAWNALKNVGSPIAGEWEQWTGSAYHIRRRLSQHEKAVIGPATDIRQDPEYEGRLGTVRTWLPKHFGDPKLLG